MKLFDHASLGERSGDDSRTDTKGSAQGVISSLIQEVVDRNLLAHQKLPEPVQNIVSIVDGEVGIGKSFTLKKYVVENPACRTLIFLERKEGVQQYAEELNGVAIYSHMGKPSIGDQLDSALRQERSTVVMTHAALKNMLETGRHINVFDQFDLIAVDETFTSLSIYANDYDSLSEFIGTLCLLNISEAEEVGKIIKDVTNEVLRSYRNQVELLRFTNDQKTKVCSVIQSIKEGTSQNTNLSVDKIVNLLKFLSNIAYDQGRVFYVEKSNNSIHLISAWSFFPKNRSLIVLADGASKEGAIVAMKKHSPEVEVRLTNLRHVDWSGHTFHIECGASGKGTINDLSKKDKEKLIEILTNFDRGLVLSHKGIIEELSQNKLINKHDFIHWANHRGTNSYSNHKAMYILSLWWQPITEYSSKYLSEVNKEGYEPGEYEMLDLPIQTLTTEIKQAVGRINRNNEHEYVDVYIRFPKGEIGDLLERNLQQEFRGATFETETWYGLEPGSRERKVDDIVGTVGNNFPSTCLGMVHSLNNLVGEEHRRTLGGYRGRNRNQWDSFINKLNGGHGLICTTFKESGRRLDSRGKKLDPNTWVVYRARS